MVEAHPSLSDLQAIAAVYERLDHHLQSLRDTEDGAGDDPASPAPTDHRQRINDQAYFVLAWGQLEADIEEACRNAIRDGQLHVDRRCRRAWSLYNPDDRRLSDLSFESRLTLVLEKGGDEWKRTIQRHNVRNQIAHGTLLSTRVAMANVIQDFFRIQSSLTLE